MFPHPIRILLALLVTLCWALPASAADVKQAEAALKRAEANLQLVDSAIGHLTAPPKGSAAKLQRSRLDQAQADVKAAGQLVGALKDGGAGVAEVRARLATAETLAAKLEGILAGAPPQPQPQPQPKPGPTPTPTPQPAPAPAPAPAPNPAPGKVKLGYPHADNLKNAEFNLRRVEGDVTALSELVAGWRQASDRLAIDHRATAGALGRAVEAQRQAGFVRDGLKKLPTHGEGVEEAGARLAAAEQALATALEFVRPLDEELRALVDPRRYPELPADLERVRALAQQYQEPATFFQAQRAAAAEAYAQRDAALAEVQRVRETYARLVQQDTEDGRRVQGITEHFLGRHQAFLAAAAQNAATLPQELRKDLAKVDKAAEEAVAAKRPLWFTGGIPQQLGWIDEKLGLLAALDPVAHVELQREAESLRASIAARATALAELIIRENRMPSDAYTGADRDAILAIARDAWGIQQPGFELLSARIPAETWSRETKWTYSNGTWYFVDVSTIQVRLIVADPNNAQLAVDQPIDVKKDHQKGDRLIGVPMRAFGEDLSPNAYLLRSNVK